jgi:hypothetical protein
MASAMSLPISRSPLAEMVATWRSALRSSTFFAMLGELGDGGFDGLVDAALEGHAGWRRRRRS